MAFSYISVMSLKIQIHRSVDHIIRDKTSNVFSHSQAIYRQSHVHIKSVYQIFEQEMQDLKK